MESLPEFEPKPEPELEPEPEPAPPSQLRFIVVFDFDYTLACCDVGRRQLADAIPKCFGGEARFSSLRQMIEGLVALGGASCVLSYVRFCTTLASCHSALAA
jgi:hypothetical protein